MRFNRAVMPMSLTGRHFHRVTDFTPRISVRLGEPNRSLIQKEQFQPSLASPFFTTSSDALNFLLLLGVGLTCNDMPGSLPAHIQTAKLHTEGRTLQRDPVFVVQVLRKGACVPGTVILGQEGTEVLGHFRHKPTGTSRVNARSLSASRPSFLYRAMIRRTRGEVIMPIASIL